MTKKFLFSVSWKISSTNSERRWNLGKYWENGIIKPPDENRKKHKAYYFTSLCLCLHLKIQLCLYHRELGRLIIWHILHTINVLHVTFSLIKMHTPSVLVDVLFFRGYWIYFKHIKADQETFVFIPLKHSRLLRLLTLVLTISQEPCLCC